jgi:hypothetical protein
MTAPNSVTKLCNTSLLTELYTLEYLRKYHALILFAYSLMLAYQNPYMNINIYVLNISLKSI